MQADQAGQQLPLPKEKLIMGCTEAGMAQAKGKCSLSASLRLLIGE